MKQNEIGAGAFPHPPKDGVRYKVIAYVRVSNEEARTGSHTFETQGDRIRERLDELFGPGNYELVTLRDDGVSGGYGPQATGVEKRVRKTLRQLQQELRTGTYDVFIVYHSDRFARSARWFFQMLEDDILPHALFVSVTEAFDMTTPAGRAMAGMTAVFNGMTRDRIIERNLDAVATRTGQGYFMGQVPYGWKWQPRGELPERGGRRRILPIPEQGRVVVQIKEWYLGGWGLDRIAAELNRRGVPPPSAAEGKEWSRRSVEARGKRTSGLWSPTGTWDILRSPVHAGLVNSRRHGLVRGEHWDSRFLEPEERERVLAMREGRKKFAATNTGNSRDDLLLNGIAHCALCGGRLHPHAHSGGKWRVYRCRDGTWRGPRACPGASVAVEELDQAVLGLVARAAHEPAMRALIEREAAALAGAQDAALHEERAQLEARRQSLRRERAGLVSALSRGTITDEDFKGDAQRLAAEEAPLRERLEEIEGLLSTRQERERAAARAREGLFSFEASWAHLDLCERRQVLRELIESLTVENDRERSGPTHSGKVATTLRVKIALLPEQTLELWRAKRKRVEKPTTGLPGLTPRDLAYLYWVDRGKTRREAAKEMGVCENTARGFECEIRKRLGVKDLGEAARMARGTIHARLDSLPLGPHREGREATETRGGLTLSAKVLEVLPLLASAASVREVARITGLPWTTVSGRRQSLLDATDSKTVYEAVQKARKAGYPA